MWKCKHCNLEFQISSVSEKANHSRWCSKNPKRNKWNKTQATINQFGDVESFNVTCAVCSGEFAVKERAKLHPQKDAYYCSKSCSNNRQHWWNNNATAYRTIAFHHWIQECAICKFDKVVAVHHIDENRSNNAPQNLIPLCPNHHEMIHSKWRFEVVPLVEEIVNKKWAISDRR